MPLVGSTFNQLYGVALLLIPVTVLGHCKIVHVAASLNSSEGPRSHGFGVDIHNKYPWFMSQGGDAGADSPLYSKVVEYVANPVHPCGASAAWGPLDIDAWLSQADGLDVATTAPDGKFEALIFQVNRDGGGECTCEYDLDATAKSWNVCRTLVNPPGIKGMWPNDRVNHTATFQMPSNVVCGGGAFKDKCIVRIRCGDKLRFGGCFAIKTPASPPKLRLKVEKTGFSAMSSKTDLTPSDISDLATKVFDTLNSKGAFVSASQQVVRRAQHNIRAMAAETATGEHELSSLVMTNSGVISEKVLEIMRARHLVLAEKKAAMVIEQYGGVE